MGTVAGHRLVDRVVDGFVDQMVQSLFTDIADIHGGALTDGLKALKHLNVTRGIIFFLNQLFFCHFFFFLTPS